MPDTRPVSSQATRVPFAPPTKKVDKAKMQASMRFQVVGGESARGGIEPSIRWPILLGFQLLGHVQIPTRIPTDDDFDVLRFQ
jgi:hypothetical protein